MAFVFLVCCMTNVSCSGDVGFNNDEVLSPIIETSTATFGGKYF